MEPAEQSFSHGKAEGLRKGCMALWLYQFAAVLVAASGIAGLQSGGAQLHRTGSVGRCADR